MCWQSVYWSKQPDYDPLREMCEDCALNGQQPWSSNPLLVCMWHGGYYPALHFVYEVNEEEIIECPHYKSAKLFKKQER